MEHDKNYPTKFDLNDFSLSSFFGAIPVYLNLQKEGKLTKEDYSAIIHASEILKEKSRDFRMKENFLEEIIFFWELYGKKENESKIEVSKKLFANRLIILSEELAITKDLPKKRIEELEYICSNLSQKIGQYWEIKNPTGFKRYQH